MTQTHKQQPTKSSVARRTLHYYWQVTRENLGLFALWIMATIGFIGMLTYVNTYVIGLIVNRVQAGGVPADMVWAEFGPFIAALIGVNVIGQLSSKLQDFAIFKLEINGSYRLARHCFDTLSNQSMTFHTNRFGGSLVSQTSKFIASYSLLIETVSNGMLPTFLGIFFTLGLLSPHVPLFTLALAGMIVVYLFVAVFMFKKILPRAQAAAQKSNRMAGVLSDAVTNIMAVKTYGREDYERDLFDRADRETAAAEAANMRATLKRGAMTSSLIVIIMSIAAVFIAGGNAWFGISAGVLVMIFNYTYNLTMRFNMINSQLQRLNKIFGDASEMTQILDEPTLVADEVDAHDLVVTHGAIDIENLSFSYTDSAKHVQVFEGLTLHIPAGQRVGLVGMSGSGKTTLTKLLLRLSDVQAGHILVDGQDISRHTQQSLRRQVAYVPQEALLFHRSIAENIAYGKVDATRAEIEEAAELAHAYAFIEDLPQGFDTMVGERGIKLSGGQRQRIAIARAILANAPILVLDEATSALDSESEAAVQDALKTLMRGRTALVVAHRLSTVASLDRIVVLRDGVIVEDGTHDELLAQDGEYAALWNRQTGAFLE